MGARSLLKATTTPGDLLQAVRPKFPRGRSREGRSTDHGVAPKLQPCIPGESSTSERPARQIGDGGVTAPITDTTTGKVVAGTDATGQGLVIHAAPLNPECGKSPNPEQTYTHRIRPEPDGWKSTSFDDSSWMNATVYSEAEVGAKGGSLDNRWDPRAKLIWTKDLRMDNTILWRKTVPPGR